MEQKKKIKVSLGKIIKLMLLSFLAIVIGIVLIKNIKTDIVVKYSTVSYHRSYKHYKTNDMIDDSFFDGNYKLIENFEQYSLILNNIETLRKEEKYNYDRVNKYDEIRKEISDNYENNFFEKYSLLLVKRSVEGYGDLKNVQVRKGKISITIEDGSNLYITPGDILYIIVLEKNDIKNANDVVFNVKTSSNSFKNLIFTLGIFFLFLPFILLLYGVLNYSNNLDKLQNEDLDELEKNKIHNYAKTKFIIITIISVIGILILLSKIKF